MHRMRSVFNSMGQCSIVLLLAGLWFPARGDLIRPNATRAYPDIAGDIVGAQTYTFDPNSQTGTFQVINVPHVLTLGRGGAGQAMVDVLPDQDGTLSQTLQLKLDKNGRLVENPNNHFELHGTVVIGDQVYRGLLLEGKPTAFGADARSGTPSKNNGVFDLNMKITGGKLAEAFGPEAYFRITPQSNSTFQGSFASNFSGDLPLTSLRTYQGQLPAPVPEPAAWLILTTCTVGVLLRRFRTIESNRRGLNRNG